MTQHPIVVEPPEDTRRLVVLAVGVPLYGVIASAAVYWSWHHYELVALFLQAVLLLPTVVIGLKGRHVFPYSGWDVSGAPIWTAWTRVLVATFLVIATSLSWRVVQGVTNPDESAYRFQARILGSGRLVAPPPEGAPDRPTEVPVPLKYNQHVLWRHGWFSKYPIGWPLVLAGPEKLRCSWLINPLLASGILMCTAMVARAAHGPRTALLAVAITVLSPYFLAQCIALMSHALAGLLTAAACLLCLEGIRCRKLSRFALMYLMIVCAFHVRPLTTLIVAAVLSISAFVCLRREPGLALRLLLVAASAGIVAAGSILVYNRAFTGGPILSPYALQRGLGMPAEISATLPQVLLNIKSIWRSSAQATMLFSFPLVFLLAALGFWKNKQKGPTAWILLAIFSAIVLGHLVQVENSGSVIPERYWFEGFFAITILAAEGVSVVAMALKASRRALTVAACGFAVIQLSMTVVVAGILLGKSSPSAAVRAVAESFLRCSCVVFLKDSPSNFSGEHLNLNGPDWTGASVFYAVDPGPEGRSAWSLRFGHNRWVVITYDPITRGGVVVETQGASD